MGKFMSFRIGVMPLPVYCAVAALLFAAAHYGRIPANMIGGFASIMVLGFLLGDIGLRVPVLKSIGGAAILSIFVPSILVYYGLLPQSMVEAIKQLISPKHSNFLYLYVSCLVTGSILGMDRRVMLQGFIRMFIPLLVGTVVAVGVGLLTGWALGYRLFDAFFYIIIPIMSGGVSEGILPLSMAYSEISGTAQDGIIPQIVPAAMIGNVIAIMSAGFLVIFGEKKPQFNGHGLLVKVGNDREILSCNAGEKPVDFQVMASGLLLACSFFIFGDFLSKFCGIPGPILMILSAAIVKAFNIMPATMEAGAYSMYKFISGGLTWPLLVGLGVLVVPWGDVIRIVTVPYILICASVVLSLIVSGFFVGKVMNMYPVEAAIVTACHSGLGGTGDVAILSASRRMELMPFAQVSTRIGGACMVIIATFLYKAFTSP